MSVTVHAVCCVVSADCTWTVSDAAEAGGAVGGRRVRNALRHMLCRAF